MQLAWAPGKGVKGKDLKDYWEGDLGVSYIPYPKLKPDIDIELLEDGGMIDEDTMPAWLKAKAADLNKSAASADKTSLDIKNASATIDTSQPPPVPGAGLLQPPLTLPLVNPFQLNNGLLAPVGMNLSGIMPNVPIGVPPPNLPAPPMMSNPLLGLGSPFGQGLLQMPMPPAAEKPAEAKVGELPDFGKEALLGLGPGFGQQPAVQDDNMDVEMEDASKPSLLGQYGGEGDLAGAVARLQSVMGNRPNPGGLGSGDGPHDVDER